MKVAYLFPGQGSAAVGMGADLFAADPRFDAYFQKASEKLGRDLKAIALQGPEEALVATENAQPAIFCLSAACLDAFREQCPSARADFFAGHSLGEYTALYAAGALAFDEALMLVCKRGAFVAAAGAAQPGTMGAVLGLEDNVVEELCREAAAAGLVVPANYNTPGQVVVSGTPAGVAHAGELAAARGGKFSPLKVSGAFHSPLVADAAAKMKDALAGAAIQTPAPTFIANVTGEPASDPELIRDLLYRQIDHPVRWRQTQDRMVADGVETIIEFGNGRVLAGMFKKVKRDAKLLNVFDGASLAAAAEACAAGGF